MKFLKYFVYIFALSSITACTSVKHTNMEHAIGLYEIVKADCEVNSGTFNPCENIYFFEILKGQFIGIKNNEFAYVFWSGYPEIDSELQYSAQLMDVHHTKNIVDGKVWLNKDEEAKEYLVFNKGILKEYHAEYVDSSRVRKITYTLKPVRRGSKSSYRMNYPGNQ